MKVYVIRHGESQTNEKKLWTGWLDVSVTEKGREDAKEAGKLLKGISFDKIYASDLKRAIETAKIAIPDCDIETSALLREIDVGDISGKPLSVVTQEQRSVVKKSGYGLFGGESKEDFSNRILQFRQMIENSNYETIAVFTHAGWLRTFLDLVFKVVVPRENMICGNCTVATFEYENGCWKLLNWINPSSIL